ncbi:MAG TPA: fasciclin domain-containing protein [Catalimonadaceae bacterium]|jgi:uncharacterized surface protein with fasciclin (FAS1) repeats|nr:fasciclin domain-containing protein [Catalimonadaceae bacterium]
MKSAILIALALIVYNFTFQVLPSFAQAKFKTKNDTLFQVIKAEEQHKLAAIEELVAALRQFDQVEEKKDVTILAPNNKAFKRLSVQTIDYLLNPDHTEELNDLLSYHTLEGKFSEKQIRTLIKKGDGFADFKTVAGFIVRAYLDKEGTVIFMDHNGRKMRLVEGNYAKGDHIIHIIDGVILPHSAVY